MNTPFSDAKVFRVAPLPSEYLNEPEQRGSPRLCVRPGILAEVLRNARRWRNGYEGPRSASKEHGDRVDCLALTPYQWPKRFAVVPEDAPRRPSDRQRNAKKPSTETIAAIQWWDDFNERCRGCEMIDQEENASAHAALSVLKSDEQIQSILQSGQSQVWVSGKYADKATGLVVPVKCLIDKLPDKDDPVFGDYLVDLKTCRNASPRRFARDCFDYHYDLQAAWELDLYEAATSEGRSHFLHIVQENFPPYELRTPPPVLGEDFVHRGRWLYQQGLALYCRCVASGFWPGYDSATDWPVTRPEPWMMSMENAHIQEIQEPEPEEEPVDVIP